MMRVDAGKFGVANDDNKVNISENEKHCDLDQDEGGWWVKSSEAIGDNKMQVKRKSTVIKIMMRVDGVAIDDKLDYR